MALAVWCSWESPVPLVVGQSRSVWVAFRAVLGSCRSRSELRKGAMPNVWRAVVWARLHLASRSAQRGIAAGTIFKLPLALWMRIRRVCRYSHWHRHRGVERELAVSNSFRFCPDMQHQPPDQAAEGESTKGCSCLYMNDVEQDRRHEAP